MGTQKTISMSKEEIMMENGFDILENRCCYTDLSRVEKAMDEHAKQEAIGFEEWKIENGVILSNQEGGYINETGFLASTPEQLYDLYLNSKHQ